MAENPQVSGNPQAGRPLSPHLGIYHWAPTMIVSITHRATGVGLSVGALVLAWWLVSVSNGPEGYQGFYSIMATPVGLVLLFGFTWSLAFHMLNGIRHLFWDMGYGFQKQTARNTALLVIALSLVIAAAVFAIGLSGHAGYLQ